MECCPGRAHQGPLFFTTIVMPYVVPVLGGVVAGSERVPWYASDSSCCRAQRSPAPGPFTSPAQHGGEIDPLVGGEQLEHFDPVRRLDVIAVEMADRVVDQVGPMRRKHVGASEVFAVRKQLLDPAIGRQIEDRYVRGVFALVPYPQ